MNFYPLVLAVCFLGLCSLNYIKGESFQIVSTTSQPYSSTCAGNVTSTAYTQLTGGNCKTVHICQPYGSGEPSLITGCWGDSLPSPPHNMVSLKFYTDSTCKTMATTDEGISALFTAQGVCSFPLDTAVVTWDSSVISIEVFSDWPCNTTQLIAQQKISPEQCTWLNYQSISNELFIYGKVP